MLGPHSSLVGTPRESSTGTARPQGHAKRLRVAFSVAAEAPIACMKGSASFGQPPATSFARHGALLSCCRARCALPERVREHSLNPRPGSEPPEWALIARAEAPMHGKHMTRARLRGVRPRLNAARPWLCPATLRIRPTARVRHDDGCRIGASAGSPNLPEFLSDDDFCTAPHTPERQTALLKILSASFRVRRHRQRRAQHP